MKKKQIIEELDHFQEDLRKFSIYTMEKYKDLKKEGNLEDAIYYRGYAAGANNAAQDLRILIRRLQRNLFV